MSEMQRRTLQSRPRSAARTFRYSLADSLAKGPVVLYFFPAAFSVGCSLEAHEFAEAIGKFEALGATVIGVSSDDIDTLDQVLGAGVPGQVSGRLDNTQAIMKSYDAVMALRPDYANRISYVIAPTGKVLYNYQSLNPSRHVEKTLAAVKEFAQTKGRP
jgi:peroxiredoxin